MTQKNTKDAKIPIFLLTFNCGKETPNSAEFTRQVNSILPKSCSTEVIPEIFVFGFQEISTLLDGTSANTINQKLIDLADLIINALILKYQLPFEIIEIAHFGSTGIVLISQFSSKFTKTTLSFGVPIGFLCTSTKAAVGVRIKYKFNGESNRETEFTFVNMHLNAGEKAQHMLKRNQDLKNIFRGLTFDDGWCILKPNSHCFIMGDMNYRATGGFGLVDLNTIVLDEEEEGEYHRLIDGNFHFEDDELNILRKGNIILPEFEEAPINFRPTYKFKVGTDYYNYKRKPSWCDRILYLSYDNTDTDFDIVEYNSLPSLKISDHLPVFLHINVPLVPPKSIISDNGFFVDRSTRLVDHSNYMKPRKSYLYCIYISSIVDFIFGCSLFIGTTNNGRLLGLGILSLGYFIYKFL